jgi:branched-chain amino acid transport system permease protein
MAQEYLSLFVNGLALGIAFFLASAGLTVLFGILRIMNFAHGSFIMVGAYLASVILQLLGKFGITEFVIVGVLVGLAVGALGLIVDRFIFRRLSHVDESVMLIATFALMLVVNGVATLIWGANFLSVDAPEGLDGAVFLGPISMPAFSAFLLVVGLVVFVVLDVFFQKSWRGKMLRAMADDRWIMSVLGHSPRRLELPAIFLAFFLAGFAGSVLAPNQILTPVLGDRMIIQAFAVVIVGGLGSIRGAFIAALVLGVAESVGSVVMPSLSLYICMIFILIVRPQGLVPSGPSTAMESWSLLWLWRGISRRTKMDAGHPTRREKAVIAPEALVPGESRAASRTQFVVGGLIAAIIVVFPLLSGGGVVFVAGMVLIGTVFAMSWNLLFGFSGMASFGHAAFFAIGGYLSAYLLKAGQQIPFELILLLAALLGGSIGMIIGIVAVRRSNGIQFAILTLAIAEVLRVLISYSITLGRDEGISGIPRPSIGFGSFSVELVSDRSYYVYLCVACGLMVWLIWAICHSAFGRTLRSIRQDSQRARFLGINVDFFRLLSFTIAAAIAAFAGALMAPLVKIVTPEMASVSRTTEPTLHTLVGGAGAFWGPAIGTVIFATIDYASRALAGLSDLVMGVTLLTIVMVAPDGVVGFLKTHFHRLPKMLLKDGHEIAVKAVQ